MFSGPVNTCSVAAKLIKGAGLTRVISIAVSVPCCNHHRDKGKPTSNHPKATPKPSPNLLEDIVEAVQ